MIVTACFFVFSSLVSVTPISSDCVRGTEKDLAEVSAMCRAIDKDPLQTCEMQRVGATKYIFRVRRLELSSAPVSVKKEQA